MSGLVHLSSVQDDFFVFEPARAQLIGRRTRRVIKLGDKIVVQVFKVDTFKKQVDFELVRTSETKAQTRSAKPKFSDRRKARSHRGHR
jgi:ribonuclease R